MRHPSTRTWIWIALGVQLLGYVVDVVWHGLVSPGVEPATVGEMARHLGTAHLPLYVGTAGVVVATATALVRATRRGIALPIACVGAVVSAAAEAWHAASHLRLDTHSAPVAGMLSAVGFVVVVVAMSPSGWRGRRRAAATGDGRRAA